MIPIIDGKVHHFRSKGNYDGVTVLGDDETGTLWDHISGEAVYGPLTGRRLEVFNLRHTTVGATLSAYPDIDVAISDRPIRGREALSTGSDQTVKLGDAFFSTMKAEDTRRPTMEIGLGLWDGDRARYYPLDTVREMGGVLVDTFAGRTVVVYVDPFAYTLAALFADVSSARREGEDIAIGDGLVLHEGVLRDPSGKRLLIERPLQVFTRWYGFALTFPATTIFER